jgi:hypothetical protein
MDQSETEIFGIYSSAVIDTVNPIPRTPEKRRRFSKIMPVGNTFSQVYTGNALCKYGFRHKAPNQTDRPDPCA